MGTRYSILISVNRMLAICCLVGLLYWTLYTELMERMKLPEEKGDEKSVRRKKIPNVSLQTSTLHRRFS